ncbi:MAG: DNA polymerase III subunit delta' [Kangiellaceae bacterium]|nr:DNA polymerase III subunit delta' [Kangiellaceae bacterium]
MSLFDDHDLPEIENPEQSTFESALDFWNLDSFARVQNQFNSGSMHHALLLLGAEGVGREIFASELAQWVLCQNRQQQPCGACKSCSLFTSEAGHPDYHVLDIETDKTQISVNQVREFIVNMQESSHQSGWKVANIANVMAMNASSFNALLKTLEEPQKNTLIILQSEQLQSVPATIRSRSQLVKLSVEDAQAVKQWLEQRHGLISADMQTALNIFPQAPYKAEKFVEMAEVFKCGEFLFDIGYLLQGQAKPIELAQKWHDELENCIFWWQIILRDVMLLQQAGSEADLQLSDKKEGLQMIADSLNAKGIMLLLEKIIEQQRLIKLKSPVNLMASWQSLLIYCTQIANKYKPLS